MTQAARSNGTTDHICIHPDLWDDNRTDHAAFERRIGAIERSQDRIAVELSGIRETLGHAPDPIRGTPGAGMAGVLYEYVTGRDERQHRLETWKVIAGLFVALLTSSAGGALLLKLFGG